jgi:hypothetical protein
VMISLLTVFVLLTVCQTVGYIVGQRFASLAHKVRLGKLADGAWRACSRVWG